MEESVQSPFNALQLLKKLRSQQSGRSNIRNDNISSNASSGIGSSNVATSLHTSRMESITITQKSPQSKHQDSVGSGNSSPANTFSKAMLNNGYDISNRPINTVFESSNSIARSNDGIHVSSKVSSEVDADASVHHRLFQMENEVRRLQETNKALEKKHSELIQHKDKMEEEFREYKNRTDETIARLRGKLAYSTQIPNAQAGARQMSPPHYNHLSSSNLAGYNSLNVTALNKGNHFDQPTFSELMRRSTPGEIDYVRELRKNGTSPMKGIHISTNNPKAQIHHTNSGNYTDKNSNSSGNSRYKPQYQQQMQQQQVNYNGRKRESIISNWTNDDDNDCPVIEIDLRD